MIYLLELLMGCPKLFGGNPAIRGHLSRLFVTTCALLPTSPGLVLSSPGVVKTKPGLVRTTQGLVLYSSFASVKVMRNKVMRL